MKFKILYSPKNELLDEMMSFVQESLSPYVKVKSKPTAREVELQMQKDDFSFIGVEFPDNYKVKYNISIDYFSSLLILEHQNPARQS